MIAAISGLLVCQLIGEVVVRALALPVPGPVAGMGLLFAFLAIRGRMTEPGDIPENLATVADALLRNLSLLFIPAATGIVQYFGLFGQFGWTIALSIAISTVLAMLVTVFTFRLAARYLATHRALAATTPAGTDAP